MSGSLTLVLAPCSLRVPSLWDSLRDWVNQPELTRQLRGARWVVRVKAILLKAPRANGRAFQGWLHLVSRPIDGDTLHALSKFWVGRVRVGYKAPDDVRVGLVKELPCKFLCII